MLYLPRAQYMLYLPCALYMLYLPRALYMLYLPRAQYMLYLPCILCPTDYGDYYNDDEDVLGHHGAGEDAAGMETDATFQHDPEHHWFSCLSEEETWNFLDKLVKATAQDLKVGQADSLNDSIIRGDNVG